MSKRDQNMKHRNFLTLTSLLCAALSVTAYAMPEPPEEDPLPYREQEILVKYRDSGQALLRTVQGVERRDSFPSIGVQRLVLAEDVSLQDTLEELRADPTVEYAEPNYLRYPSVLPNDPDFGQQWALQNTGQTISDPGEELIGSAGVDMDLARAWDLTTGDSSVVIAIIDTGVEVDHEDLSANIWVNPGEIADNGIDDDNNGFIDDINGWDFINEDNDPSPDDYSENHGTAVAGCAAAVGNNGTGVAGVNWQAGIMSIKIGFDVASIIAAFEYAMNNGADIINTSFGGPFFSEAEAEAMQLLEQAGVLLVASAGNSDTDNDIVPHYPSNFSHSNVVSVAASAPNDHFTPWSQYGQTTVDLEAPGIGIFTTDFDNGYTYIAGTSFSSPYTAGIAGLIKAHFPDADYRELKARLLAGVSPVSHGPENTATSGRANAYGSLTATPAPLLVINTITLSDSSSIVTPLLMPGETLDLRIALENLWLPATGISATLSSSDPDVTIENPNLAFPDLGQGDAAGAGEPFRLTLNEQSVQARRIAFSISINTAGGHQFLRHFQLPTGSLSDRLTVAGVLQKTDQDDFHHYRFDVPEGAASISFKLTSPSNPYTALYVNRDTLPRFWFESFREPVDETSLYSAVFSGNEKVSINLPKAGTFYVTVANWIQEVNESYTLRAVLDEVIDPDEETGGSVPPSEPFVGAATKGGKGSIGPFSLLGLLLLALFASRNRNR